MNNKGFMMAEVIVVSAVILVALTTFYVSYNKVISLYNERLDYYDPTTLYELAKYRDDNFLSLNFNLESDETKILLGDESGEGKRIYLLKGEDLTYLNPKNKTFIKYRDYLKNKLNFTGENKYKHILVMEKCDSNRMNCKYAYLEVLVK